MHSSRMRTDRRLTVCWSLLPGGEGGLVRGVWSGGDWSGGSAPGGLVWGGVCSRGVWSGGVCSQGGISQLALRQTPPVDRHTPVKILPWPNFVAAGNKMNHTCNNLYEKIQEIWFAIRELVLKTIDDFECFHVFGC